MNVTTVSSGVHIACIRDELINSTLKLKFELNSTPRNKHKLIARYRGNIRDNMSYNIFVRLLR